MLCRTASNLFWMGRHLERAETAARRTADLEAQLVTLAEQLQGPLSGQDLAPPSRPRRAPKPIDRLP